MARFAWENLAVVVLLASVAVNTYLYSQTRGLAIENRHRVIDIQESRVASCRQTYEGIREVFRPFFRPPKQRTAKERRDIAKFNGTVDRLKLRCARQTRPPR